MARIFPAGRLSIIYHLDKVVYVLWYTYTKGDIL